MELTNDYIAILQFSLQIFSAKIVTIQGFKIIF